MGQTRQIIAAQENLVILSFFSNIYIQKPGTHPWNYIMPTLQYCSQYNVFVRAAHLLPSEPINLINLLDRFK